MFIFLWIFLQRVEEAAGAGRFAGFLRVGAAEQARAHFGPDAFGQPKAKTKITKTIKNGFKIWKKLSKIDAGILKSMSQNPKIAKP